MSFRTWLNTAAIKPCAEVDQQGGDDLGLGPEPGPEPTPLLLPPRPAVVRTYNIPADFISAYNIVPVAPTGSTRNVIITIIIAYHYPGLQESFDTFCTRFSLPLKTLEIILTTPDVPEDPTPFPYNNWTLEECLDVQWAFAMNPNAHIRVVAADNPYNVYNAIAYASDPINGLTDIISMSLGSEEFDSELFYNQVFSNPNICYLAASGDNNFLCFPAASNNVLACGGTNFDFFYGETRTSTSETTWPSAGTGVSQYILQPTYQNQLINSLYRWAPDVSAMAKSTDGIAICYNNIIYQGFSGTSIATPVIAGILSNVIQNLLNKNLRLLTTVEDSPNTSTSNLLQNLLYKSIYPNSTRYSACFYDITSGVNGSYSAGTGFDLPTGLGSPNCAGLISTIETLATPDPAFSIISVSPTNGKLTAGTALTITGVGFTSGATVFIYGLACTNVVRVSSTQLTCSTPAIGVTGAGSYDVLVRLVDQRSVTLAAGFTYNALPTVSTIAPVSGSTVGGTSVVLTGTGFLSGATVKFGTTFSASVTVNSSTRITCTSPARVSSGVVNIVVTNLDTQSVTKTNAFTYTAPPAPAPTLTSVAPTSGSVIGGTLVTLTGTGFVNGLTVKFKNSNATAVTVSSATSLTCRTPANTAGAVSVVITNPDSQSVTRANAFTYIALPRPTLTSAAPNRGSVIGGTLVTLKGTGFVAGLTVKFKNTNATSVTVASATTLTCRTPANTAGAVSVVVTNPDLQSVTRTNAFTYIKLPKPTLTSVLPNRGRLTGGTLVTLKGTGFVAGLTVKFKNTNATSVVLKSATTLTCRTPANTAGAVSVVVTNPDSQSVTKTNAFTYSAIAPNIVVPNTVLPTRRPATSLVQTPMTNRFKLLKSAPN